MTDAQVMWLLQVLEVIRDLLIVLVTEMSILTVVVLLRATDKSLDGRDMPR